MSDQLREQLQAAMDKQEAPTEAAAPETPTETTEEVTEVVEEVVEEVVDETEEAVENADTSRQEDETETSSETETETEELKLPNHWSQEDKDGFSTLTSEGQQVLLRQSKSLERGANRKFEEMADVRKEHEAFNNVFEPVKSILDASGLKPAQVTQNLVNAHLKLTNNPAQGIRDVITEYGGANTKEIVRGMAQELGLFTDAAPSESDDYRTDNEKTMQAELDQIKNSIHQTQQQAAIQAETEQVNQVNLFKTATDDDGNLLNPHFDTLQSAMIELVPTVGKSLDKLYEAALYANPGLRKEIIDREVKAQTEQTQKQRKKVVTKAKTASANPKSNNSAPKESAERLSLRESLVKNFSQHTAV